MRLINVKTLRLETIQESKAQPYVILSHTWGKEAEELQFRDMESKSREERLQYPKVAFLCRQAAVDGYEWAWCDTCCIDKSSSAELSESINSMFRWYRDASICYAFLSDVVAGDSSGIDEQLRKSHWFHRGWTLQELLAPTKVHFYDRNGEFLGSKNKLQRQLTEITRINFGALQWSRAVPSYSIATRMSWAANRKTTRIEDRAYSMLGILGVNMPLLYGEGESAFRRLQEELIRVSDDETVFAHDGNGLLADSPLDYIRGHALTILAKNAPSPYSLTNAGLRIKMRIVDQRGANRHHGDLDNSVYGILDCHYNLENERHYSVALQLQGTAMQDTYRRSPGKILKLLLRDVRDAQPRDIFIQTRAVQLSRITLLEKFNKASFSLRSFPLTSSFVYNGHEREYRIYPDSSARYEAVRYTIEAKDAKRDSQEAASEDVSFITFFELATHRAGVLDVSGQRFAGLKSHSALDDVAFTEWLEQSRPTNCDLFIRHGAHKGMPVNVGVLQNPQMRQFVWSLFIDHVV